MVRSLLRAVLVAAGLTASAFAAQAQKSFSQGDLASQAVRLEQALTTEGARLIAGKPAQQLRREGDIALARGNARQALDLFAAAVAAEP